MSQLDVKKALKEMETIEVDSEICAEVSFRQFTGTWVLWPMSAEDYIQRIIYILAFLVCITRETYITSGEFSP
jgi:hypothetical protein